MGKDGKNKISSPVKIPAKGHKFGSWSVSKKATVTTQGEEIRTCSVCGKKETRKTAKLTPTPTTKPTPKPDEVLSLDKTSVSIVCGKTSTLKVLNGKNVNVKWTSSNPKVATVDSKGKVTAKMAGAATIKATAMGKTMECKVTALYKDVTSSKDFWYAPTNYLTAKGVVKGYDNQTRFKPANNCTRAQMVTFIWRLQGEPKPKNATCSFKDVKKSDYFYKACIWGNENGIVEGYKDGTFGPQIVCARKHAVTFLWRLAGKPNPKSSKSKFSDVKKSDYFYKATIWASEENILAGYKDGTFKPDGDCLRRQMVTFLYKFDKNIKIKK
ncbi:MAG: S-layer homology domain-containing protein [Clostridiales bacterium]|nr:S-layer homology domain-containing protein [Clostridiales bacterium]